MKNQNKKPKYPLNSNIIKLVETHTKFFLGVIRLASRMHRQGEVRTVN